ncbi:MAG: Gfo/Idh/MocA family oxidoreductase, partial [Anaerolineae bacterium]
MLKVAVVGVGAMGRNHARIFAEMPQTHLAAVADLDAEAAAQVARTYKAEAYADFEEMLTIERPDVVSVAVPTR